MSKKKAASAARTPAPVSAVPIVAIGASAGGIEAVTELLSTLSPTTGLAYVYVQHLDPNATNQLTTLLSRATPMPVREVIDQMRVQPNEVYVGPPDQDVEVVDGVLTLLPRQGSPAGHMPIDRLFVSLADRQRDVSIAVLLSGMANDGTIGLRAIKLAGGVTFAQDETARFQSMPRSAISEHVVDRVLPPAEIARELEGLSRRPELLLQTELAEAQSEEETGENIRTIIRLLQKAIGVDFSNYKIATIRRRIIRRMLLFKLETLNQYIQYIKQHPGEAEQLYSDLLINVTTFFRDPDTMNYLSTVVFPRIVKDKAPREPIRIWIPACSTGQEAYSLAMLLIEALGDKAPNTTIQIFATDLSEQAVARARQGSYTKGEVMDVPARRLQRFFTKTDDHYRINRAVRDLCVFAPHNVLKDPPFSRLDFISCRNLLIYLSTPSQRKAIAMFHYGLNPSGLLMLGKSETVGSLTTLFSQLEKTVKVYIRKNDVVNRASFEINSRLGFDRPDTGVDRAALNPAQPVRAGYFKRSNLASEAALGMNDVEKMVDELLLRQYVPASVVVNSDLDILRFRGSTSLFLEPSPGKASLNLLKMARPSLVFELRNTIHKARQSGQPVRKAGLDVKIKDKAHQVAIEVVPLRTNSDESLYLVLFEELEMLIPAEADLTDKRNQRIKQLEDELATLRDDMRSIVEEQEASNEELQSANEEIISSNEELQSINEELETSKEEIESTNEELLTINQELQVRNDQLSEANEFSDVIFATIREATIVLDEDLRVKSANKTFYDLFGVEEGQTEGRLIYELGNRQWDIPKLRTLLTDVVQHNTQVDAFEMVHTFTDLGERVLLINARRIVRQQDAILLAIEDITEHRRAQHLIAEREAWLHDLVENAPVLIWVSDRNGHYQFFNKAWLGFTGHQLASAIEQGWMNDVHPDDRQPYLTNYTRAQEKRVPFQMELRLKRHDGEYRWMLLNANPAFLPAPPASMGLADTGATAPADGQAVPKNTFNGYIGTCAEIYNHKTLIQALDLRTQQRMQKVFERSATVVHAQQELAQTKPTDGAHRQAQTNLRQQEDQLRVLVENTSDMITRWGPDLRLRHANSAFEQRMGKPLSELIGKTSQEMGQPDEIALPYMNKLRQVFDTGVFQSHYNSFMSPQGITYYYSRLVPEQAPDGSVQTVLVIAQDITDLKLVEEIQQTAFNLQAVLNSSPAAIGLLRAIRNEQYQLLDFELIVCNQKFADWTQRPLEQLPGLSVSQLTDSLWKENTFAQLEEVLLSGQLVYREQHELRDDTETWLGMSITKHDDGLIVTGLNITALKQAGQQQESWLNKVEESSNNLQSLEAIREQVRQRGDFLRSTSHDLRSNFGIIQGAASLLNMAETDEQRGEMMSMLQRNLRQATHLLGELLDYARLEAGQEQRQVATFDAGDLLYGLVDGVGPLAADRNLQLNGQGNEPFMVDGDAVKVHRMAQNILLNALNYTQTGSVTISWGEGEKTDTWQFTITDTGPGLAWPDILTNTAAGEGIGLLIVQQLCELLEGQIDVDSALEKGTRFRVTLPKKY